MHYTPQRLYGGVRFPMPEPSLENVGRLDRGARPMIHHMMTRGLRVDLSHFERMVGVLTEDMERLTAEVESLTGQYTNLDSGDQVSALLFKTLGLKQAHPKLTKSGDRESVENEVLVAIQHEHPAVSKILEFKELSKLRGTYAAPMGKLATRVGPGHYRMLPKLGDTRIPSGRLNCKEPNLLAMPNRTARGRELCEGFITDPGWVYVSVDESQIEPRTVAHRSQDPSLMRIYHQSEDIYSDFAIQAFRLPDTRYQDGEGWHYPGVDKKTHRFPAKTCILAAIYDVTNVGLLEQMPIVCEVCRQVVGAHSADTNHEFRPLWTEDRCQDILNAFYLTYPGILAMRKEDHRRARRYGYLWDEFGRLLHIAATRSKLEWVVSSALREAGNFPIQSTAQGTVKLTMAAVYDDMVQGGWFEFAHPVLQIHDELLFECREGMAEELAQHVAYRFETSCEMRVPIKASYATSPNWGKLQK